jgi:hypothetical protein
VSGSNKNNNNAALTITPEVTSDSASARRFLAAVVPWPGDGLNGFVNIHALWKKEGEDRPTSWGVACRKLEEAINCVDRMLKKPDAQNVYFCVSLQSKYTEKIAKKTGKKWRAAARHAEDAVALKSFFLDIDFGSDGHEDAGYATQEEAAAALADFVKQVDMPDPSFINKTGGRLHVFWVLPEPITPAEWKPYAHALAEAGKRCGLKADYGCTVNAAQILRVPGTFNHKTSTPRSVETIGGRGDVYSLDRITCALEPYKVAASVVKSEIVIPPEFLARAAAIKARYAGEQIEGLGASIDVRRVAIDLDAVAAECGFLREALDTGGRDFTQPLWNYTTLIATFAISERADAHRMASGHPDYTKDSTDALYDRKVAERAAQNLGWPSCKAVNTAGCRSCASCPNFAAGKSPLNLASPSAGDSSSSTRPQAPLAPVDPNPAWIDCNKYGSPLPTYLNTKIACRALGISFGYDKFHERRQVGGQVIIDWAGELSDNASSMIRDFICNTYKFDPGKDKVNDVVLQLCNENSYDPVLDYLGGLKWDGVKRLDTWMTTYLGAENTPLVQQIGRLALIAGVRRARQPGCKFDQIVVLEGQEGKGKSTAILVMAGEENFSDQAILDKSEREQQEACAGIWLYEIAELDGMTKAEVSKVKAFASRTHDRARPAYGRHRVDQPRRCIYFATTNETTYLKSQTGNRRFWPVLTREIDLDALRRDRDQLWAEAAAREAAGASLVLPENLWAEAGEEQDARLENDPWEEVLAEAVVNKTRVHTEKLFEKLNIPVKDQADFMAKRIGTIMKRLGWHKAPNPISIDGRQRRGFVKDELDLAVIGLPDSFTAEAIARINARYGQKSRRKSNNATRRGSHDLASHNS